MGNFNNDDVKKMLEMLKEQAESNNNEPQTQINTQTTDNAHTDEDIQNLLKEQFSSENGATVSATEDYSFDAVDEFMRVGKTEEIPLEIVPDTKIESEVEELEPESEEIDFEEPEFSFVVAKIPDRTSEIILDGHIEEDLIEESSEFDAEAVDEVESTESIEEKEIELEESIEDASTIIEDANDYIMDNVEIKEKIPEPYIDEAPVVEDAHQIEAEEPVSEESIDYSEVLEGQQGTVFNEFVEDFSSDLDDVVFEAEITESRAPDKQYTIFEDWEQIIKKKDFATAEEDIIPPSAEDFEQHIEDSESKKMHTDYFNPIVSENDLDAVDIALMVALGGESELNQTVGFEKIRQAVHDAEEEEEENLENKQIYGFAGEEYSSLVQNIKIKKKYRTDKAWLIAKAVATGLIAVAMIIFEIVGWINSSNLIKPEKLIDRLSPNIWVGFLLLIACLGISYKKFIKLFKDPISFSSLSFMGALITSALSIVHSVIIIFADNYASLTMTLYTMPVLLLFLGLVYDLFDFSQQSYVFNMISLSDKKLVLEPYGKIKTDDDSEVLESDSYCISRVPSVKKYFARTSAPSSVSVSKLIPLLLSFSVSVCVMLLLLLMNKMDRVVFGFILTFSVLLICTSIFEGEFAFFEVYRALKKRKTGIIGKSSIAEYGKCNVVYFDDFNVFDKKSVRTKGLKLYDNNEIYRILYHTQAVFSKVGGPLKGVFEFATSEMTHSNKVEIKEISKEGISALVDGRTAVLIGTGAFMRSRYIHPSYTSADLKLEESGEENIMFIALNGVLGAKLYVTYQFSAEFERLARKLSKHGVKIGIRSSDPNVNNRWAKKYGEMKKFDISIVRPTLKEIKPNEKSIDSGVVSVKNVRALTEALMMCIKLNNLEVIMSKVRAAALVVMGILSFALLLRPEINIITVWVMLLSLGLGGFVMALLTHFYIKN